MFTYVKYKSYSNFVHANTCLALISTKSFSYQYITELLYTAFVTFIYLFGLVLSKGRINGYS